ncbi:DUF4097 family beta strand repeat-containing protein [Spirillospora sp. NPDC049652]
MSLPVKSLTATAALLAVLPLSACGASISGADVQKEQHTYSVPRVKDLQIVGRTGSVEVVGADVTAVSVTERLRFTKNGRPSVRHQVVDGRLEASYSCPNSFSLTGHTCEVDYRVTVPRTVAADLRTDTGHIKVTGVNAQITARTNTGSITGTALRPPSSARISARADTGSIRLTLATAPAGITANANTGQIRIAVPGKQQYAVNVDTNTGSKKVDVPTAPNASHTIKAHTDTGDVSLTAA